MLRETLGISKIARVIDEEFLANLGRVLEDNGTELEAKILSVDTSVPTKPILNLSEINVQPEKTKINSNILVFFDYF